MSEIKRTRENENEFERILFVCKARSNAARYPFASVLHVERGITGSRLIASDGRRLHFAEIRTRIKSGDYKPVITKDIIKFGEPVTGIRFPNWRKIIPDELLKKGELNLADTGLGKDTKLTERLSFEFNNFVKKTGTLVNLRYLEDLPKKEWVFFSQNNKQKALVLKQKDEPDKAVAVIMPLGKAA
ncbi:hypothetical protein AGMMS50212_15070 [Spirochaetia bacterium]|nr:hypothetical protein AGMMS50212_15070 [Spirochaetia bacterium]